jgi:hypothetical protein
MLEDVLASVDYAICDHTKRLKYTRNSFDILEGYEYVETKYVNCHKMLRLNIRKLGQQTF